VTVDRPKIVSKVQLKTPFCDLCQPTLPLRFPWCLATETPCANSRKLLGIIILGGMLASAIIETLMAPSFYSLVQILKEKLRGEATKPQPADFTN